jgi:hypothetical protein
VQRDGNAMDGRVTAALLTPRKCRFMSGLGIRSRDGHTSRIFTRRSALGCQNVPVLGMARRYREGARKKIALSSIIVRWVLFAIGANRYSGRI